MGVAVSDSVLTIDLSGEAWAMSTGGQGAYASAQQLVYTASATSGSELGVQLLVEGEPAGLMWEELDWSEPIYRDPSPYVLLLPRIDSPAQGETVARTFQASGVAMAGGAALPWSCAHGMDRSPWTASRPRTRGRDARVNQEVWSSR